MEAHGLVMFSQLRPLIPAWHSQLRGNSKIFKSKTKPEFRIGPILFGGGIGNRWLTGAKRRVWMGGCWDDYYYDYI